MRPIDADAIAKTLQDAADFAMTEKKDPMQAAALDVARSLVMAAPTVEPEPEKRGRWEDAGNVIGYERCSCCKNCYVPADWVDGGKWKYCPECGAKMDLEG